MKTVEVEVMFCDNCNKDTKHECHSEKGKDRYVCLRCNWQCIDGKYIKVSH